MTRRLSHRRPPMLVSTMLGFCCLWAACYRSSAADSPWWSVPVLGSKEPAPQDPTPLRYRLGQPFGVAIGPDRALYVTEITHHRVLRFDPRSGQVTVVAGNGKAGYDGDGKPAVKARLKEPYEVRFDGDGNLYVVEMQNHVVRRVRQADGVIETIAGTGKPGFSGDGGPAKAAQLQRPHSIEIVGHQLLIADIGNHRIRAVDLRTGQIDTIAGNGQSVLPKDGGPARGRPVAGPRALAYRDGTLWVALREGHSIWQLDLQSDRWQHVAGTGKRGYSGDGGAAKTAQFDGPKGIAVDAQGALWIADTENNAIRRIDPDDHTIATVAGGGQGVQHGGGSADQVRLGRPHGIAVDAAGRVYVADTERLRVQLVVRRLRAGIIGLDTSHVIAFTGILNRADAPAALQGVQVVAAYPPGSPDIESSVSRRAGYVKTLRQQWNVTMVDSIDALLKQVDVVLLESNDGRPHLEQALPVLEKKLPLFIDKPIAGSLVDAVAIFAAAERFGTPVFSSSSLRFGSATQAARHGAIGKVRMASTYSPCSLEKTHPDLFWYGIHGVESLFAVMGPGCREVRRVQTPSLELVTGRWNDDRIGTFQGIRPPLKRGYGGTAFGERGIAPVGNYDGYQPLLMEIVEFFRTGIPPVTSQETLEIYAFMWAADVSKQRGGEFVSLSEVMEDAKQQAAAKLKQYTAKAP